MTADRPPAVTPTAEPNVTPLIDVMLPESERRDALAVRADRTVVVRVDGAVPYGRAVEAMDVARAAGTDRIGLLGVTPAPTARE